MLNRDVLLKAMGAKAHRHAQVTELLQQQEIVTNMEKLRTLSREHGQLDAFARVHGEIVGALEELEGARELAAGDDPEMAELAELEIAELEEKLEGLWTRSEELLADDDEMSARDVIVEIRGGVGGAEAALFAGDLFTMYQHFCQQHGLKIEVLGSNEGEMGGFKEIMLEIRGKDAYKLLQFESGGHRVQRVPKTETQGRIHTSAATVAVLPKAEEVDIDIDWVKDVREDKMRDACSTTFAGKLMRPVRRSARA